MKGHSIQRITLGLAAFSLLVAVRHYFEDGQRFAGPTAVAVLIALVLVAGVALARFAERRGSSQ